MDVFEVLAQHRYGELHLATDERTGLQAIVALHHTGRGPGLGGTRCVPYASTDAAIVDAVRLARGMSYKAAMAGLDHGGGKAVIVRPPGPLDRVARVALFEAFGRFVDGLGGRYITTEDSGTSPADMDVVRTQTRYVVGVSQAHGGSGDPSPWTARGVRRGIEACWMAERGHCDLDGVHVAIQGVGHVGYHLARELHARGARLTVADIDPAAAQRCATELGAAVVAPDQILAVECDVLSPCALGAVLDDTTLPTLRCRFVAGAANNQLARPEHGELLHAQGIRYAPDYVINAGGLISVADEWAGWHEGRVTERVDAIYDRVLAILTETAQASESPARAADRMAEALIFGPHA